MPGMFTRLWHRLGGQQAVEFPPLAPDEPFTAVGDIHGRYDLLMRLVDQIAAVPGTGRLVFLGDYADRGDDSAGVLQALLQLQQAMPETICLRGNHEEMLLNFLENPLRHGPAWQRYGGRQTLASYGVAPVYREAPESDWRAARDSLRGAMGDELIGWLADLPVMWQTGNLAMVHAAADPARPMPEQQERDLLWGHPDFRKVPRRDGIWIVHGHTIVEEVQAVQGRIAVDTGAFATGRLSAACIRSDGFQILTT